MILNAGKKSRAIAFYTFGCKLNFAETSTIARNLQKIGYEKVSYSQKADIVVINNCLVTERAEKKFEKLVREIYRKYPLTKIVAIGCYSDLQSDRIASLDGIKMVLGNNEKFDLHKHIHHIESSDYKLVLSSSFNEKKVFRNSFSSGDRTRTFLKIQDGCDYFCSYCTIPLARGKSRGDTIGNILESVKEIISTGVKEIVLTGVNIGDFKNSRGERFINLLEALEKVEGLKRVRMSSIEPDLLTDDIIELVAKSEKILPHFHIPLQSGSDKILKLMNRKYDTKLFLERYEKIKAKIKDVCIGLDIIVGFPGEAYDDFKETQSLLSSLNFSYLHVFTFSERPNTPAIKFQGKIDVQTCIRRRKTLQELSEKKKLDFYNENLGSLRMILFESGIKDGYLYGWSDNYVKVKIKQDTSLENKIREVKLIRIDDDVSVIVETPPLI